MKRTCPVIPMPLLLRTLMLCLLLGIGPDGAAAPSPLLAQAASRQWMHGAKNCSIDRNPAFEVFQADADTYILRQNKCLHFEAPFIYVLFGAHTVFVQDTGGKVDDPATALLDTLRGLIEQRARNSASASPAMLVAHSHSHRDHTGGDAQFRNRTDVTLVEPQREAIIRQFKLSNWPQGSATLDLGGRMLQLLPTPGHQDESLTVFDERTGWLLTGDTVYPGLVLVQHWPSYVSSVQGLAAFARQHRVSFLMGTHIEMSRGGKLYPVGTTYQPEEAGLGLQVADLFELDRRLQQTRNNAAEIVLDRLVVQPIGPVRKALGAVLKALGV